MKLDFVVNENEVNMRLDDFFSRHHLSRKLVKDSRNHGAILRNGEPAFLSHRTCQNDRLTIVFPKEESHVVPVNLPLHIVYEDDYVLVIDKQPQLATIPNRMYYTHSLGNAVMYYYQQHHIESAIHFVNRLDKDTQGLLLVAKYRFVHDFYSQDIKKVKRVYHALVAGHPGNGTIDAPIAHDPTHATRRMIDANGVHALTRYQTLKEYEDSALVECVLETGRTHQIRVHMASIGHPLLGDVLYNPEDHHNFYLDSVRIEFPDIITNKKRVFEKRV